MAALYNRRPNFPISERISRQHGFFNNEGWQFRGRNEFSGLDDFGSYNTIVADPGHLTSFITDADGIYPSTVGTTAADIEGVFAKLISWVGFVEDDGTEVPPNYTRSRAAGGTVNIDVIFTTELNIVAGDADELLLSLALFPADNSAPVQHLYRTSSSNVTASFPLPNVIRISLALVLDDGGQPAKNGIEILGNYRAFPQPTFNSASQPRMNIDDTFHITTVAETGHTAVDLCPLATSTILVPFPEDATKGASTLTVVA